MEFIIFPRFAQIAKYVRRRFLSKRGGGGTIATDGRVVSVSILFCPTLYV